MTPTEALQPGHARWLMTPTSAVLETLQPFSTKSALLAWASQPREVPCILPRLGVDVGGVRPVRWVMHHGW